MLYMNGKKLRVIADIIFEGQEDMGQKLDVGQSTISQAISNKRNLPFRAIDKLVNDFQIDGTWLIVNDNDYQIKYRKHANSYQELERKYILLLESQVDYSTRVKNIENLPDTQ